MKKLSLFIFVVVILLLSGCAKNPDFEMSSEEFSTLFDGDELEASLKYDDKIIRVSGSVSSVRGDKNRGVLKIGGDDDSEFLPIKVIFTSNVEDILNLKIGTFVIVQGKVIKDDDSVVSALSYSRMLTDSKLLEFSK